MKLFTHNKLNISTEVMNEIDYIYEVWSGVHTSTAFRKLINQSLEIYKKIVPQLLERNSRLLLLADVSQLELISSKDIDWLTNEVNPKYEKLGFTHQAVIMPKSKIAQKTVSEYEGEEGNFITRTFSDDLKARRWFMEFAENSKS